MKALEEKLKANSNRFKTLQEDDVDVSVIGADQVSKGIDNLPSPAKILKDAFGKPVKSWESGEGLNYELYEDEILNGDEKLFFENALDKASDLFDLIDTVKQKPNKRMNDPDAGKFFDVQDALYGFIIEAKEKFINLKLELGEYQGSKQILKEIKSINCRLTTLESKNKFPVISGPTWGSDKKLLAVSSAPVSKFPRSKPSEIYGTKLFENSITFENVLNVDENDEESLKIKFLNIINERLNGILPSLERSSVLRVTPVTSKANSYLISFHESFDAQIILDCGFRFSGSNLQSDERIFLYPLLSPSEREFQLVIMKRFQKFQVKDLNKKYNFRIYTSGYDLKVKTDEKAAFFKLKSGDVKEMISDQIIKNFLIEETGVSI